MSVLYLRSLPPSPWLSPTSSSSHLSFSICLSSCNISVWPFHPLSLVCPSHLVWNPPPPFLHFSISLHLEGSLFPQGESDCLSDLSSRTILCPSLILLSLGLPFGGQLIFVLWEQPFHGSARETLKKIFSRRSGIKAAGEITSDLQPWLQAVLAVLIQWRWIALVSLPAFVSACQLFIEKISRVV